MNSLRRNFPLRRTSGILILFFAALILIGSLSLPANACWTQVVRECFDRLPTAWPWCNPSVGPCWGVTPTGGTRWGIQAVYYSTLQCSDQQSAWCIGLPNTSDPRFDHYPANLNTIMFYGPVNLSQAVEARCVFEVMNSSEAAHDSVYWGAAPSAQITPANMALAGSLWGVPSDMEFHLRTMDLKDLHHQNGDSVSMLGQTTVFVFWGFRSDANQVRDIGAFVDNVVVTWDDGSVNLASQYCMLVQTDSTVWPRPVALGDSTRAAFTFSSCRSSTEGYSPFHVIGMLNDSLLIDTVITGMVQDELVTVVTNPWLISSPGNLHVRFVVDSLNDIAESNENDNACDYNAYIRPPNTRPTFEWVTPSVDTIYAPTSMMLRWNCVDPDSDVTIDLYYDTDLIGCAGPQIAGGQAIHNSFGADSLSWMTIVLPRFRTFHPFAHVADSESDTCIYAPYPIVTADSVSGVLSGTNALPQEFFLAQNYPNPFNPETVIPYGLPVRANVTLRVFDLLGHEVAVLARGTQEAGFHSVVWNASQVGSGVYFYRLEASAGAQQFRATYKLVVLK